MDKNTEKPGEFKESDAGDGTTRADHHLTGSKLWLCAFSIILCAFLVALDQLIVTAVITTIADHFHSFQKMSWMLAAYLVSVGGCCQTWGRISISFGRKRIMIVAIVLFETGSLISAVAQSMNAFIVGRAVQGVGGSGIQTLTMVLMTEITTIHNRPVVMACVGVVFMVASVLGPIIGGVFGTFTTWRWCFYLNLCCGGLILPFFILTYKTRPPVGTFKERLKTVDFLDNFLLIAAIVLLCLGITFGQIDGWSHASCISSFVIGGVLAIVFCIYNFRYSQYPAIPADIVQVPGIDAAFLGMSFCFGTAIALMQVLSIYFQNVAGHNSLHTGLSLVPLAVPMTICSMLSAVFIKIVGRLKMLTMFATITLSVGTGILLLLPQHEKMGYSIGFQLLVGIGVGAGFQGPLMSGLVLAPKTPGSTIMTTALFNTGRSVVSAILGLISGVIYTESLKTGLRHVVPKLDADPSSLAGIVSNMELIHTLDQHDRNLVVGQVLHSVHNALWMCVATALTGLVFTLFMSSKRMPKKQSEDVGDVEAGGTTKVETTKAETTDEKEGESTK